MSFDQVWSNRVEADMDAGTVRFISKENLTEHKRHVGPLIDLADVQELETLPSSPDLRLPD